MQILEKVYSATDYIGESFTQYWKNIVQFSVMEFILGVVSWVLFMVGIAYTMGFDGYVQFSAASNKNEILTTIVGEKYLSYMMIAAPLFLISVLFAAWQKTAMYVLIKESIMGRKISISQAFSLAFPLVFKVILMFITFMLFVVLLPSSIIFLAGMAFKSTALVAVLLAAEVVFLIGVCIRIVPLFAIVVFRDMGILDSILYSFKLVKGFVGQTALFILLLVVVNIGLAIGGGIVSTILQIPVALLGQNPVAIIIAASFIAVIVNSVIKAYMFVPVTLYYINREAFFGDGHGNLRNSCVLKDVNVMQQENNLQ